MFRGVNMRTFMIWMQLPLRAAVAAGLAVALAQLCRFEYPIYALISAVIVTDFSPSRTSHLGLQRLAATVVGAACGASLRSVLQPSAWAIGFGVFGTMFLCHLARLPNGSKVAGYICGIVMIAHGGHAWHYAFHRFIETALGISAASIVSFVPMLIRTSETEHIPTLQRHVWSRGHGHNLGPR